MTSQHEVVSPLCPVPEGMIGGNHIDIIRDKVAKRSDIVGHWLVKVLHHPCNTERHKVNMGVVGVSCSELHSSMLNLMDKPPLDCVDVLAWSIMYNR